MLRSIFRGSLKDKREDIDRVKMKHFRCRKQFINGYILEEEEQWTKGNSPLTQFNKYRHFLFLRL